MNDSSNDTPNVVIRDCLRATVAELVNGVTQIASDDTTPDTVYAAVGATIAEYVTTCTEHHVTIDRALVRLVMALAELPYTQARYVAPAPESPTDAAAIVARTITVWTAGDRVKTGDA